ncbi:MAG: hypothetical protein KAR38_12705 [Calditrichia bacterium]|nr:hypothetical protein [Calditrichia bacterium]
MEKCNRKFLNVKLIIGLGIISIGVLLLLKNMGFYIGFNVWDLWPLILIAVGINHIYQPAENKNVFGGAIFILVGVLFLLRNFDLLYFDFRIIWPLIIILIGGALLKQGFRSAHDGNVDQDFINLSFIMGGGEFKFHSKTLKGGNVFAVMGGCKLDLTEADFIEDKIVIDTFTFWGGIEIKVPQNWQVNMQGTPLLGGMDNKSTFLDSGDRPPKQVIVKGMAIMGGVEVKN